MQKQGFAKYLILSGGQVKRLEKFLPIWQDHSIIHGSLIGH
jgi:hypothetical protein